LFVVILGIFALSKASMSNAWLDGEKGVARLGTLVIPVTATGTVQSNSLIQVKSKASGQVLKIHVVEGQMVEQGKVLIELDPVDEKRNVESRQADLDRIQSAYEKAKIALDNQKRELPLQTQRAQARLDDAKFKWEMMKDYVDRDVAAKVEYVTHKSNFELADADLKSAKNNEVILLTSAEQDVIQAEASLRTAQKVLDEAKLRFDETTVRARCAGMVYSIMVRPSEMIQSGTQSLTGGTTVMTLSDVSSVLVIAQVDEADIGAIRKIAPEYARPGTSVMMDDAEYAQRAEAIVKDLNGKTVEVTVEAYRGQTYQGVIERILPEPKRINNALAFDVRVRLVGDDLRKLVGLQADLAFTTEKIDNVVLVRNEALVSEGRSCFVYVPKQSSGGRWVEEKKPVKIGVTDGTDTEVVTGLKAGEEVWVKRPKQTEKEKQETEKS
jgi:multidrug efflux pump subunit AcrA (membrane-fusion protein)